MSEIEQLTKAISGLQQTNKLFLNKLEEYQNEPVFITTLELQERWRCKYALINSQMKKGLRPCKMSNKKMMFRLTAVKEWENQNF